MLYLLDANILITAHNTYYPIDRVPEFWTWIQHQGNSGFVKIPTEIYEEILAGNRRGDMLLDWIASDTSRAALNFDEIVNPVLVRQVVSQGYANDLTDDEVEKLGRDPFLIAYALVAPLERCVVTTEISRPTKTRHNKKIPDVCSSMGIPCCDPFRLYRDQGFMTSWRP